MSPRLIWGSLGWPPRGLPPGGEAGCLPGPSRPYQPPVEPASGVSRLAEHALCPAESALRGLAVPVGHGPQGLQALLHQAGGGTCAGLRAPAGPQIQHQEAGTRDQGSTQRWPGDFCTGRRGRAAWTPRRRGGGRPASEAPGPVGSWEPCVASQTSPWKRSRAFVLISTGRGTQKLHPWVPGAAGGDAAGGLGVLRCFLSGVFAD